MADIPIVILFGLSLTFGVGVAAAIWRFARQNCVWYVFVALGLMGGIVGTVYGLFLSTFFVESELIDAESPFLVFATSALFAAILQGRYANKI